jgi:WD repeat-containing protein 19
MLIRCSNNISKFPAHTVPILTSTVIECYRSGLKEKAFEYASVLMRPEYRPLLDPKYKRKLEQIVRYIYLIIRRPEKGELEDKFSPCPYCNASVSDTEMICPDCKSNIPYCIASGQHMILSDWSECPKCHFPAIGTQLRVVLEHTGICPMCSNEIEPNGIIPIHEPLKKGKVEETLNLSRVSINNRSDGAIGGLAL